MPFDITIFFYLAAAVSYVTYLVTLKRGISTVSTFLLVSSFLLHTISIAFRYPALGRPPFIGIEALSFLAWAIVGTYLVVEWRFKVYVLGSIVAPISFMLLILSVVIPERAINTSPFLHTVWFPIHVTFAFIGYALFSVAFAAGVMYIIQEKQVKARRLGAIYKRLPSLDILDEINSISLNIGFPIMTIGIISGYIWSMSMTGTFLNLTPRAFASSVTWILYATLLFGRLTVGWRGRKAAYFAIAGFTVSVLFYFAINVIWGGHAFK